MNIKRLKIFIKQVDNPIVFVIQLAVYKIFARVFGLRHNAFKWIVPIRHNGFNSKYVFQVTTQLSPEDKPLYNAISGHKRLIDVGCNIGSVADYFIRNGGEVAYCFDPSAECVKFCKKHLKKCNIYRTALGNTTGSVKFYTDKKLDDFGSIVRKHGESNYVPICRLDDIHLTADLIKYDTEGYDLEAIKGSLETISRCKPTIIFEDLCGIFNDVQKILPKYKFRLLSNISGSDREQHKKNLWVNWIGEYSE